MGGFGRGRLAYVRLIVCANIATHPDHQKKGAASKLMIWPFDQADRDGLDVYLETNAAV